MDPWMDATHRGLTALAKKGPDPVHVAGPIQARGLQESPEAPANSFDRSGGAAKPEEVRGKMETAFGADFSSVRIHEGPNAEAVGALAYTQGTDIHFAPGQYQPGAQAGQELLGHELTHVVQQSQGRVRATRQAKGVDINDDAPLQREAAEMGLIKNSHVVDSVGHALPLRVSAAREAREAPAVGPTMHEAGGEPAADVPRRGGQRATYPDSTLSCHFASSVTSHRRRMFGAFAMCRQAASDEPYRPVAANLFHEINLLDTFQTSCSDYVTTRSQ
jgi:hypothetical protein